MSVSPPYSLPEVLMDTASVRCQIVLAEDNPADVGLVRQALRDHEVSCDLRVIADGEAVVTFIDSLDLDGKLPCPDLLLLDLHLPKRDGPEILRHLRASERCGQTPVVVLTSSEAASDRQNAEKNAAVHYFRKSASLAEFMLLGKIVKEVLSHRGRVDHPHHEPLIDIATQ